MNTAEVTFWGGDPTKGYTHTLKELGPAGSGLVAQSVVSGRKGEYRFRYRPQHTGREQPIKHYTITARPIKRLVKNQKSFFTDETGVIRFTTENRAATRGDPPIPDTPPSMLRR
jgi:hypothetical protein